MAPSAQLQILVADDEPVILSYLKHILEEAGFIVRTAVDGKAALQSIQSQPPDIAVLDLQMPGLDGFAVGRKLREDPLFEHLPLIILSAQGSRENKVSGLDLGADDFITKPIDAVEFLARIRMILKRTRHGLDANPLTHLPGNISIQTHIETAISSRKPFAVLYLDLNEFKAYNDVYGYDAGDRVIKATAELLLRLTRDGQGERDFVGHIGGDDFIVIARPAKMVGLAQRVIAEFDALVPSFYTEEDRKRRKIVSLDRQGNSREFELLSIAIGICHNMNRELSSFAQVSQYGAELKKHAKTQPKSSFVIDRRMQ